MGMDWSGALTTILRDLSSYHTEFSLSLAAKELYSHTSTPRNLNYLMVRNVMNKMQKLIYAELTGNDPQPCGGYGA